MTEASAAGERFIIIGGLPNLSEAIDRLECELEAALPFSRGGFVMALSKASICDFGWKARDFALKGVDEKTYTLTNVRGPKGTLVVFICNHCPYVKASIGRIVAEAKALRKIGVGTIAIMPNDTEAYGRTPSTT